jgi:hypothetical protein
MKGYAIIALLLAVLVEAKFRGTSQEVRRDLGICQHQDAHSLFSLLKQQDWQCCKSNNFFCFLTFFILFCCCSE